MSNSVIPPQGSTSIIASVGLLCKAFLFGLNRTEVCGIENLTNILDKRLQADTLESKHALITVSNHTSVLDDPLLWGILPFPYLFNPINMRWGLGSHDLCFKNRFTSTFFTKGQVLPTYRLAHSPKGGLFQPLVERALRMLCPFSELEFATSSLRGDPENLHLAKASDTDNLHNILRNSSGLPAWLHVFPEGRVHQHPSLQLRYFRWGISRFILELPQPPIILPMFLTGFQDIMHESRTFPRFIPRAGKEVTITVGEAVPLSKWSDVRRRWRDIRDRCEAIGGDEGETLLREGPDAVQLRIEVASMVRHEVEKIRVHSCGYPPEDPSSGLAETYKANERKKEGQQDGQVWEKEQ